MKAVQIEICEERWHTLTKAGSMPWTYYGGYYNLKHQGATINSYSVSPYEREYPFLEQLAFY